MVLKRVGWLALITAVVLAVLFFLARTAPLLSGLKNRIAFLMDRKTTVGDRLTEFGPAVDARWKPFFRASGLTYPPAELALLGFKAERRLDLYARAATESFRFVRSFPILAASGQAGPKLRNGDRQVPEGRYRIESLNPNSRFHLSLRLDYPNAFDRQQAARDGRTDLGGDIMIHGDAVSIGCLAMGDEAAEDLFVLAARTGLERIQVLLCPVDFRSSPHSLTSPLPEWTGTLYADLQQAVVGFPLPTSTP